MKKIFSFVAIAALVFGMASCKKNGGDDPKPGPDTTVVRDTVFCIAEAQTWNDQTSDPDAGWWQIIAETDEWYVTLSNLGDHTVAEGEYEIEEMDYTWSFFSTDLEGSGKNKEDQIHFVEGVVTVTVETNDAGKQISANVAGNLLGDDDKLYAISLTWTKPGDPIQVREQEIVIPEATFGDYIKSDGMIQIYGYDAAEEWQVGLTIITDTVPGTYTEDDLYYIGRYSWVADLVNDVEPEIFSANITVTETEDEIKAVANLLCYDSTLYKVTLTYEIPDAPVVTDTVEVALEGELTDMTANGLIMVYAEADDESYAIELVLYSDALTGEFTFEDLYAVDYYTWVYDAEEAETEWEGYPALYDATVSVAEGASGYDVTASIICRNGKQYDFTIAAALATSAPRKLAAKKAANKGLKVAKSASRK